MKPCTHHKKCGDCFSPEVVNELTTEMLLARRTIVDLLQGLDVGAFMYRKDKKIREAKALTLVADHLRKVVSRISDETLCNDNCKSLYFCELKKGHKGKHKEGFLAW